MLLFKYLFIVIG